MSLETQSRIAWRYFGIVILVPQSEPRPKTKTETVRRAWIDYHAYIRSPAWRALKDRFLRSRMPKNCLGCWTPYQPNFELHHRTYARLGAERLDDLCLLCRACHQAVHDRYTKRRGTETLRRATKRALRPIRKESMADRRNRTRPDYRPKLQPEVQKPRGSDWAYERAVYG